MAMRSVTACSSLVGRAMGRPSIMSCLYSSDGKGGRIFNEEERAKETMYIQKMERERLEKQKEKADKEKAHKDKEASEKVIIEGFGLKPSNGSDYQSNKPNTW